MTCGWCGGACRRLYCCSACRLRAFRQRRREAAAAAARSPSAAMWLERIEQAFRDGYTSGQIDCLEDVDDVEWRWANSDVKGDLDELNFDRRLPRPAVVDESPLPLFVSGSRTPIVRPRREERPASEAGRGLDPGFDVVDQVAASTS